MDDLERLQIRLNAMLGVYSEMSQDIITYTQINTLKMVILEVESMIKEKELTK